MNSMIESDKFPGVFFLNDWAQGWAENTVDEDGKLAVEEAYNKSVLENGIKVLMLHPKDIKGETKIPSDYSGIILRYSPGTGISMLH